MLQYLPLPRSVGYSGSEATAKLDVHIFLQLVDARLEGESLSDREAALLMRHQLEGSARSLANSNAAAANSHSAEASVRGTRRHGARCRARRHQNAPTQH